MEENPVVSVVIPTYKRPKKLNRALESVINQTYQNLEIIVVNDDPDTNIDNIIDLKDDRIVTINHNKNKGAPAARNNGIRKSKGDFIALLDDDDKWLPKKIEKQVIKFETVSPKYGLIYSWTKIKDEKTRINRPEKKGDVFSDLLENCFIPSPTPLIKKEVFQKVGLFDETLKSCQDWDMWLRIAKDFKITYIPKVLTVGYKAHNDRISVNLNNKLQGWNKILNKYDKYFKKNKSTLSKRYKIWGVRAGYLGARKNIVSDYFKKSYKYDKKDMMSLFYFIVSKSPKKIRKGFFTKIHDFYRHG